MHMQAALHFQGIENRGLMVEITLPLQQNDECSAVLQVTLARRMGKDAFPRAGEHPAQKERQDN
jgi:hypothetical protein